RRGGGRYPLYRPAIARSGLRDGCRRGVQPAPARARVDEVLFPSRPFESGRRLVMPETRLRCRAGNGRYRLRRRASGSGARMTQPTVYPLFSTPVYVNNVGDFEKPDVKALEFTSTIPTGGTYNFSSSVDKNVLELAGYAHVKTIVMREVEFYARQILAVTDKIEFYVTNSWINVHRRGQSAGPHMHHNSFVSGVLY